MQKKISSKEEVYLYLATAEKNSLRLKKLVSDLFLHSKIMSSDIKIDLHDVNLKILLNQILELKDYPVNFINKISDAKILANVDHVCRIIENLFDNACKYATKGKEITLCAYQYEDMVAIELTNYTEEDLSTKINLLTKRLYTADKNRDDFSSGLGLSIVSELMKKMDGKLSLHFDKTEKTFSARLFFRQVDIK